MMANASPVNIKNIYVQVVTVPSGAGEVYVTTKSDQTRYIKEAATWGETSSMKATLEQNGEDPDGSGMYEAIVKARAAEGYEFLCYSYESESFGDIFLTQDIYKEASTTSSDTRVFTPAILPMGVNGTGAIINVNCLRVDGNSDDPGRDNLYNNGTWSENPDKVVYAIFRKIGDVYPCLDEPLPVEEITIDEKPYDGRIYNLNGQIVDETYKGIVIQNGKKILKR